MRYHTYWFDPACGSVFCLAEGPDNGRLRLCTKSPTGCSPAPSLELRPGAPLNSFLGSVPNHPAGTSVHGAGDASDRVHRCLRVGCSDRQLGDEGHIHLLREHNDIVRGELAARDGREVKHTGDGIMASFDLGGLR